MRKGLRDFGRTSGALRLGLPVALCSTCPPISANVMPEGALVVHVQPSTSGSWQDLDLQTCTDLQTITAETGTLDFAVFFYPIAIAGENATIVSLETSLGWPDEWNLIEWEPADGATGALEAQAESSLLKLSWPGKPMIGNELNPIARFVFEVPSAGAFRVVSHSLLATEGLPFGPIIFAVGGWARAGEECTTCSFGCSGSTYGRAAVAPEIVQVALAPDSTTGFALDIQCFMGGGPVSPCPMDVAVTETWLTVSYDQTDWHTWQANVTVSSQDLAEGEYMGWVEATSFCSQCAMVLLSVTAPPPVSVSWGEVKGMYRER